MTLRTEKKQGKSLDRPKKKKVKKTRENPLDNRRKGRIGTIDTRENKKEPVLFYNTDKQGRKFEIYSLCYGEPVKEWPMTHDQSHFEDLQRRRTGCYSIFFSFLSDGQQFTHTSLRFE